MGTYAIGDIHGCLGPLLALLDAIQPGEDDTVVTLGDHTDRGPESCAVIQTLIELADRTRLVSLCGNHEIMMTAASVSQEQLERWYRFGGQETMISYYRDRGVTRLEEIPDEHWAFVMAGRRFHETDSRIFVHANLNPALPLAEQSDYDLFWRKIDGPIDHVSGKTVVCGHSSQRSGEPLNYGKSICIDTRAYGGLCLCCLEVESGDLWMARVAGGVEKTHIDRFLSRNA